MSVAASGRSRKDGISGFGRGGGPVPRVTTTGAAIADMIIATEAMITQNRHALPSRSVLPYPVVVAQSKNNMW
jgi:hypothetical protein